MWLVNKYEIENRIEVLNPDSKNEFGFTNRQFALFELKPISYREQFIEQEIFPDCEIIYQKYDSVSNQIIEVSAEERKTIDEKIAFQKRIIDLNWLHENRTFRLTLNKVDCKKGGKYSDYVADMMIEKVPFYPDSDLNGKIVVYMEELPVDMIYYIQSQGDTVEIL